MDKTFLLDLGKMPYGEAWRLQKQVWQLRVENRIPDTLILVEHPAVITLGKSGKASNLLVSEDELKRRGIPGSDCRSACLRVESGGEPDSGARCPGHQRRTQVEADRGLGSR